MAKSIVRVALILGKGFNPSITNGNTFKVHVFEFVMLDVVSKDRQIVASVTVSSEVKVSSFVLRVAPDKLVDHESVVDSNLFGCPG